MIVDHDHRRRAEVQRLLYHFAGVDCRLVERSFGEDFIGDQPVFGVKIEHPDAFMFEVRHVNRQVIDQGLPTGTG